MRSTYSIRGVQPMAGELHAAQDGYEYGPTGNYKFTLNLLFAHQFSLVFVYWPKPTLLLPVWPRDTKTLDTPV